MDPRGLRVNQNEYFHSEHMQSNFYYWYFVNQLQELEIWKCDGTDDADNADNADAIRTDRCEGWNVYIGCYITQMSVLLFPFLSLRIEQIF